MLMKLVQIILSGSVIAACLGLGGCAGVTPAEGESTADGSITEDNPSQADPVTPSYELVAHRNLSYTLPQGVDSEFAKLDLFRMDDGETRPLVLMVHGGSWASGDKAGFEDRFVPWWIEQGYVAVPVNFRLASRRGESPTVKPRDQVQDLASALAWLVENSTTYGISTDRIILLGYSSGAHLVALLGTDERFIQDVGIAEHQIQAVLSLDVHAYDVPFALDLMEGSVVEQNIPIIRHLFGDTEAEQLEGSPINYLDGWAAPAFVVSVDADPEVVGSHGYIVSQAARRYVDALIAAGHHGRTIHDVTETHSTLVGGFGEDGDSTTESIVNFLAELP